MKVDRVKADWQLELQLFQQGLSPVAGLDEAGRGALAGPVVAAVVVLPYGEYVYRDSKTLTVQQREHLAEDIKLRALAWALAEASASEVDALNVLQATKLAARRAVKCLEAQLTITGLVTDYLTLNIPQRVLAVAKADSRSVQVAAASILAKTHRDALMQAHAEDYPAYDFARNKGYGSAKHLAALQNCGSCALHRQSFKPVAQGRLF